MGKKPLGLDSSRYAQSIRWRLDFDYLDQLSEKDREWLIREFVNPYYNAEFRKGVEHRWSPAAKREMYTAKNVARRDLYSSEEGRGRMQHATEEELARLKHEPNTEETLSTRPQGEPSQREEWAASKVFDVVMAKEEARGKSKGDKLIDGVLQQEIKRGRKKEPKE